MNSANKKYNSDKGTKKISKSNEINALNKIENKDTSQHNKNLDIGTDNEEKKKFFKYIIKINFKRKIGMWYLLNIIKFI